MMQRWGIVRAGYVAPHSFWCMGCVPNEASHERLSITPFLVAIDETVKFCCDVCGRPLVAPAQEVERAS